MDRVEVHPFSIRANADLNSSIPPVDSPTTLVLLFADPRLERSHEIWAGIRGAYPTSTILGCSTAGNINGGDIVDGSVEGVAVRFSRTSLRMASLPIENRGDSFQVGSDLGRALPQAGLRAVFLLSDGLVVNGSELIRGLGAQLPAGVSISGGLAADGTKFKRTWLVTHDFIGSNRVSAVGLYGEHIHVSYGSQGGWDKFGIERRVTRSAGPVLYELDGKPALSLYKQYLGEQALGLPATGLLFPLAIRSGHGPDQSLVRTILAVNEDEQSLTFAGDVPVNSYAQLMKANSESLIEGAASAAVQASAGSYTELHSLALAVSCVGRRLVLKQRAEEELEALQSELPPGIHQIGFYAYGEVAPSQSEPSSSLHNQTMTLTLLHET